MISTKFMGAGTAMFVIGALGMGGNFFGIIDDPNILKVSIFMALVGGAYMVLSVIALAGGAIDDHMYDYKTLHAGDSNVFSVGLLRCMLAITIADGKIQDSEVDKISNIFQHLTGSTLDEETIRYTAEGMLEEGTDIKTELATVKPVLNKMLKKQMITASLYVLAADGDMNDDELIMLDDIREGLGFSMGQCERMKKKFLKNMAGKLGV